MPYRKRRTMRRRKRRVKPQDRSIQSYIKQGVPAGLPTNRVCLIRWNDIYQFVSTSGTLFEYFFRANSCFDPQVTAGGSEPQAGIIMRSLYNHAVVLKSKISCTFVRAADTSTGSIPFTCGINLEDDGTNTYVNARELIEARKGTHAYGQSDHRMTVTSNYDAKKFFNVTDVNDNIDRIGYATASVPNEEAYYNVYLQGHGSTSVTTGMIVTIDYLVEYSEPKDI